MDNYIFRKYLNKCTYVPEDTRYIEIFNYSVRLHRVLPLPPPFPPPRQLVPFCVLVLSTLALLAVCFVIRTATSRLSRPS